MRFVFSFLIIIFLLGCNHQTLSNLDKVSVNNLHQQMLKVNQLIEELDLLLIEFQKSDELAEAIEMMETANSEANKVVEAIKAIKFENNRLTEYRIRYEAALIQYTGGLQLQIDGMKNWDGQKTTEGYKQTELAKHDLNQYYEEINSQYK
ncbi:MAG TPA: hypothetical protein GXX18_15100 [Bacillales bacterium]|nr:hypothetical protein [Bacillales bacterium]